MSLYITQNNQLHDDAGGEALLLPTWPKDAVLATDDQINAILSPVQPKYVPQSVSRAKGLIALELAGHLSAIEAYMSHPDTPKIQKLAFDNAQEFARASPTVAAVAQLRGLTDDQIDDLFIAADAIVI